MKSSFGSYYALSDQERELLWNESTIVLDTNVLLDLYRVPEATRVKLLDMLQGWKGRLWIPHQVGVEFHGRRVQTIGAAHRDAAKTIENIRANFLKFIRSVEAMELHDRGHPDVKDLLDQAGEIEAKIVEKAQGALAGQLEPRSKDPILEVLDTLLAGSVGPPPINQKALDDIYTEGGKRYLVKMGPGFEDAGKAQNERPKFMVGGLVYETQYSDLLLWKQIINYAKDSGCRRMLFVTKDVKKDWWQMVNEKDRISPLPELRAEICREAGVEVFWMYTLDEAIQFYGEADGVEVTQAIEDVKRLEPEIEFENSYEKVNLWFSTSSADRLQQAAEAMNLHVVKREGGLLAGYSTYTRGLAAVLINSDSLEGKQPFLEVVAKRLAQSIREKWSVNELYFVVLLPEGVNRPGFRRHLAAINYGLGGGGYEHETLYG